MWRNFCRKLKKRGVFLTFLPYNEHRIREIFKKDKLKYPGLQLKSVRSFKRTHVINVPKNSSTNTYPPHCSDRSTFAIRRLYFDGFSSQD